MDIFLPILLFVIGLLLLIKGGDWFVDGATGLAQRFHLPELLIGATVVSIGTTLPEVMVSAGAALQGVGDIAYGNAIGSVICNTALIAALTLAIRPGKAERSSMKLPVLFFFIAAVFYSAAAILTGRFERWMGFVLLGMFVLYMVLTVLQLKRAPARQVEAPEEKEAAFKSEPLWKDLLQLIGGAAFIVIGARLLVDNGQKLAEMMGVPESVIALTFVALGTSLPELVTAITALAKGHGALSLGNIIGANLFNLVTVSGISVALNPFDVPAQKTVAGMNASFCIDIPLMFLVMLILTVPPLLKQRLYRWQGITLLCLYAGFCVFQFAL